MNEPTSFSLRNCYFVAWKSFSKWWLPICLIAGGMMVFNWLPKLLSAVESSEMRSLLVEGLGAVRQVDVVRMDFIYAELVDAFVAFTFKLLLFSLYAMPFAALLTVLLYCFSLIAVKDRRRRYSVKNVVRVTFFQFALALVKVLTILVFPPFGFYVYVKLLFVSLLMLEEGSCAQTAVQESWAMTRGRFWPLLGLVFINGGLQLMMAPTVIGVIPALGVANTARAAAYAMIRMDAGGEKLGGVA
jgi:hypothetical protein